MNNWAINKSPRWLTKTNWGLNISSFLLLYVGSFLLYPYVFTLTDGIWYSSSMFLIASSLLFLNALIQSFYFVFQRQKGKFSPVIIQILQFLGWLTFLVGSVLGSPTFDIRNHRDKVYVGACIALALSYLSKIFFLLVNSPFNFRLTVNKFHNHFYSLLYTLLGLLLFLFGTIIFLKSEYQPKLGVVAVPFYQFGAMLMIISSLYTWKIYFGQKKPLKQKQDETLKQQTIEQLKQDQDNLQTIN